MAKATRLSFGETLAELGTEIPEIVVLDADLSKSTQSQLFAKKFPERFFEMGIQETNMVGVGAGLALSGKIPFICSFAVFLTGRYETIRMSVAYNKANVKIVGTHGGLGIGEDGNSQMGLEDLSLMRSLPNMKVLQPADDRETVQAVRYMASHDGPMYIRLTRQKVEDVHDENYQFEFGKADQLKPGTDITLIATGGTVFYTLEAAHKLEAEGIRARVINIHTLKPFDAEAIVSAARETGGLVTVEDHNVVGGLGSATAEALCENYPAPLRRIGLQDTFGESGSSRALYAKYGLDTEGIYRQVKQFIREKEIVSTGQI